MLYGSVAWDPILIICQIIALQCLFYLTIGLAQAVFLGPFVGHLSVAYIFNWRTIEVHNTIGWMNVSSNVVTACLTAVYIMWIVERAKKCVDFATTTYFFHFVLCWVLSGFPASLVWWSTNGIGLLITALLGEWLCVQRELQDIPLNSTRARGAAAGAAGAGASSGATASASARSTSGTGGSATSRGSRGETAPLLELAVTSGPSGTGGSGGSVPRLAATALAAKPQLASSPR